MGIIWLTLFCRSLCNAQSPDTAQGNTITLPACSQPHFPAFLCMYSLSAAHAARLAHLQRISYSVWEVTAKLIATFKHLEKTSVQHHSSCHPLYQSLYRWKSQRKSENFHFVGQGLAWTRKQLVQRQNSYVGANKVKPLGNSSDSIWCFKTQLGNFCFYRDLIRLFLPNGTYWLQKQLFFSFFFF